MDSRLVEAVEDSKIVFDHFLVNFEQYFADNLSIDSIFNEIV